MSYEAANKRAKPYTTIVEELHGCAERRCKWYDRLSTKDVVRMQGMIHKALALVADMIEASTDWDCDARVLHAITAGLRGDPEPPRDD